MKTVLLASNELHSDRFMRFCERLNISSHEKRQQVFGALNQWYFFWAADNQLDSGVWLDKDRISLNRFGQWAEWADAPAFGKALWEAGYVRRICEIYPDEISGGPDSQGLVAANPLGLGIYLDESFKSIHRRRANANELVLYLTDPRKRAYWAVNLHVDAALLEKNGRIPKDWLSAEYGEDNPEPPDMVDVRAEADCRDRNPHQNRHQNRGSKGGGTLNPSSKKKNIQKTTGAKPTNELRNLIREKKFTNPKECLYAIDSSSAGRKMWDLALQKDAGAVQEILAELVATDEDWAKIRNPAAVVISFLRAGKVI